MRIVAGIAVSLGLLLTPLSAQDEVDRHQEEERSRPSEDEGNPEGEGSEGLTEDEAGIVVEGLRPDATEDQRKVADELCKDKCKVCHDGIACDVDCVKQKCAR